MTFPLSNPSIPRAERVAVELAIAIIASVALAASAKIAVPFYPVPMTMQTFVVLGLGLLLGPWRGAACVAVYLVEGALGFPVFTGTPARGVGLAYMVGPTGGYLVGFMLAVIVVGIFAKIGWDRRRSSIAVALCAGVAALYAPGLLWLGATIGWDQPLLELGLYPFVPGEIAKMLLLLLGLPFVHAAMKRGR